MATALERVYLLFTLNSAMFSGFPKILFFPGAPGWGWAVEQSVRCAGVLLTAVGWTLFFLLWYALSLYFMRAAVPHMHWVSRRNLTRGFLSLKSSQRREG